MTDLLATIGIIFIGFAASAVIGSAVLFISYLRNVPEEEEA